MTYLTVNAGDVILAAHVNDALAWRAPTGVASDTANSAAIGTTETIVLTVPSATYKANTAYEILVEGGFITSAISITFYARLRKTTVAGQVIGDFQRPNEIGANPTLAHNLSLPPKIFTVGATAVTASLQFTLQAASGTVTQVANTQAPRRIDVTERGETSAWPSAPILV